MKIIIRAPNWLGDAALAVPALKDIQHNFPQAKITILGHAWAKELYQSLGFIQEYIPLQPLHKPRDYWLASHHLREGKFDLAILLTNSFASALLLTLARIPQRWGYAKDGRSFLLTKTASPPSGPIHQVEYYRQLLQQVGCSLSSPGVENFSLSLPSTKNQRTSLAATFHLDADRPWVILHPGAAYGPAKRWPPKYFSELAGELLNRGLEVIIIGTAEDIPLGEQISSPLSPSPKNLCGQTSLSTLLQLLQEASLVVANDSGPLHLANLLQTPVVALFGPTDPRVTGPYRQPAVVLKKEAPCWPCRYQTCPFDHRCLTSIAPEEVLAAAEKFIG
ncbi:MAG: lipopolysaccharide heptosyltransferase II [Candidatus Aminicenantes bacterium]|nr:lipopolysaccharide heptosyltransferase II [Candidatus Aminicenantes bacterium]